MNLEWLLAVWVVNGHSLLFFRGRALDHVERTCFMVNSLQVEPLDWKANLTASTRSDTKYCWQTNLFHSRTRLAIEAKLVREITERNLDVSQFDSSLDVARSFHSDPDERTIYTERDEHMCGGVESGRKEKKVGKTLKDTFNWELAEHRKHYDE